MWSSIFQGLLAHGVFGVPARSRGGLRKGCLSAPVLAALALVASVNLGVSADTRTSATYFRFKLDLLVDGKPFALDFVGGCGAKVTSYAFGGRSLDFTGMTALTFGAATPDGHAVGVKTIPDSGNFNPCLGHTTANGRVPRDWLPFVVWFERADVLAHGLAYVTQDAYRNPNARLGFRGATVESATAEEFEAFTRRGPKNLFPPYLTDWLSHAGPRLAVDGRIPARFVAQPEAAWPYLANRGCTGATRVRLTEEQRARVRAFWPAERPRFWIPASDDDLDMLRRAIPDDKQHVLGQRFYNDMPGDKDGRRRNESYRVYPASISYALHRLTPDTAADGRYYLDIRIGDGREHLGFMDCDTSSSDALEEAITGRHHAASSHAVDLYCRIDGTLFDRRKRYCDGPRTVFFENDEFAIMTLPVLHF